MTTRQRPLRVLVKGGGIAGRTVAKSIASFADVTVLELKEQSKWEIDRGIGIWPKAINCLKLLNVDCIKEFHAIPPAAYRSNRSPDGTWLSRCSDLFASKVPVNTILENKLIDLLEDDTIKYKYSANVVDICEEVEDSSIIATLSSGETVEADVCIVASGSSGKNHINGNSMDGSDIDSNVDWSDSLSGIVSNTSMDCGVKKKLLEYCCKNGPFEVLISEGIRLAVVPLSRSSSFFWFISFSSFNLKNGLSINNIQDSIDTVIQNVQCSLLSINDLISCSNHLLVRRTNYTLTSSNNSNKLSNSSRIFDIGDASNYLSNNLAQAGSIAIEDGYLLGYLFRKHFNDYTTVDTKTLEIIKCKYQNKRRQRITKCRTMNRFTQLISNYPMFAEYMKYVPPKLNEIIFDQSLIYSLGGKEYI